MPEIVTSLKGSDGGARRVRKWLVEEKSEGHIPATVFIAHGYAEHCGRYRDLAEALNNAGFNVIGIDHRGHGESEGSRADIPRFEVFCEELLTLIHAEAGSPGNRKGKVILLGHSMGGAIATCFACRYPDELDGLILSGAAIRNEGGASPALRLIARILGSIAPQLPVKPFDADGISKDPAVVAAYKADPLVYTGGMKARMGREMLRVSGLTEEKELSGIRIPLLIMHGGSDRLVEPECSRLLERAAGSADKTLLIFEGLFHEIFNEPEKKEVFEAAVRWLDKRFG
jgi:alpha-beta hydrolase superfamily lysophospholipase